ncbi:MULTISPECIES: dihydrofolate reductase family protein [Aeromicrobium]|uniref:dihydrofolate reductase family protein n=1 Tax=Aeromicrobium TaxID=2040 RepID=UPI0025811248|nr:MULTISPECIES: dihydrofolate reductase family protein [Aeromicrobium]
MTATYTFDVFASVDGYGSYRPPGDWGGYWGKQGPEFVEYRDRLYSDEARMVFGGTTFREFVEMFAASQDWPEIEDSWVGRMRRMPATVVSSSVDPQADWVDATMARGDAVDVVTRLKEESDVPLRSHGSLSLNWALLAAGLVDVVQLTVFPVITGQTGERPVLGGAADFDLELVGTRTFDGRTVELTYRPSLRTWDSSTPTLST